MRKDDKDIWGILNCEFIMYIEIRIVKYQEVPVWRQVPLGVFFLFINFFFRLGQANVYLQLYVYRYISFSFYQIGFFIFTRLLFLR